MDFFEACEKYSKFPRLIILKIELQRRGFILSQSALDNVNILIHQTKERSFSREIQGHYPVSFMLRDGTSVVTRPILKTKIGVDPFLIDFNQERFVISFHGIEIDEVFLWERPDYYEKSTSKGTPMWHIANSRPQRLDINPFQ